MTVRNLAESHRAKVTRPSRQVLLSIMKQTVKLLTLSALLLLPAVVQAQFTFTTNNGAITITGYTGPGGDVTIPNTTNGYPVTSIAGVSVVNGVLIQGAFANCTTLTNITIPDSITNIGSFAFVACINLTNVNVPNTVTTIEDGTFNGCLSLASFIIPNSITNIGIGAFAICSSLKGVIIPTNVNSIGFQAFYACASLTNVVIPASITSIGHDTFAGCSSLASVTIPNSVTNFDSAFRNCTGLISLNIPTSITSIGFQTFYTCTSLASIAIPNSVTSIGQDAFASCTSLTNIAIPDSVTNIDEDAFGGCFSLTSIIIPPNIGSIGYGMFYDSTNLTAVFFKGNAPTNIGPSVFYGVNSAIVYYLPLATGWEATFAGRPTALWLPQAQTTDASFGVRTNQFGFNINWASGQTVVVEACTNLTSPVWQSIQTNLLTTGSAYFSDSQWANYPGRFYRLRSP